MLMPFAATLWMLQSPWLVCFVIQIAWFLHNCESVHMHQCCKCLNHRLEALLPGDSHSPLPCYCLLSQQRLLGLNKVAPCSNCCIHRWVQATCLVKLHQSM